jgi:uncharacterized protein (DUF1330 family)
MAVYMIVETKITDKEVFSRYGEKIDQVFKKYGGRFLARGGGSYSFIRQLESRKDCGDRI